MKPFYKIPNYLCYKILTELLVEYSKYRYFITNPAYLDKFFRKKTKKKIPLVSCGSISRHHWRSAMPPRAAAALAQDYQDGTAGMWAACWLMT
jgi:hypothetical protein